MTAFMFSDKEIQNATAYIKDDRYIASIYGVQPYRVARLRKERRDAKRDGIIKGNDPKNSTGGGDSELLHRKHMEEGSARLRNALMSFFVEREKRIRTGRTEP